MFSIHVLISSQYKSDSLRTTEFNICSHTNLYICESVSRTHTHSVYTHYERCSKAAVNRNLLAAHAFADYSGEQHMVHYRNWHVHQFRSKFHCAKHRMIRLRIHREYEASSYIDRCLNEFIYWSIAYGPCFTTALDGCCAAVFDVVTCVSILSPKAGPDD